MNIELGQILTIVIQYLPEWPIYTEEQIMKIANTEYAKYAKDEVIYPLS